jgi:ligand-binding SRPBCC domain-containing protein
MTTLHNEISIAAPQSAVWQALTRLDALGQYDPGVKAATLVGVTASGPGAQRRCELRPAGWFVEQVDVWEPDKALSFELVTCSLPVASLRHDYTLGYAGGATRVTQVMTYTLKYGQLGRALDVVAMRRKWDRGIKAFLTGLKDHVEAGHVPVDPT